MATPPLGKFYVYILYRPYGDGLPCYVGKGTGKRLKHHAGLGARHYNKHLANIFAKAGGPLPHNIVLRTDDEQEAFAEEIRLIAFYGRKNLGKGPLCNLTDGGDGHSGFIPSEESNAKRSASLMGNKNGVGNFNRRGAKLTEEQRARMKGMQNCLGKKNALGYRHTDEWKAAASLRMKGNAYTLGMKFTPQQLENVKNGRKIAAEKRRVQAMNAAKEEGA